MRKACSTIVSTRTSSARPLVRPFSSPLPFERLQSIHTRSLLDSLLMNVDLRIFLFQCHG